MLYVEPWYKTQYKYFWTIIGKIILFQRRQNATQNAREVVTLYLTILQLLDNFPSICHVELHLYVESVLLSHYSLLCSHMFDVTITYPGFTHRN